MTQLEPLLKEADDYYEQENYKDDKMAKGKALHPRLVAAWDAFASADKALRDGVDAINDRRALERLAEIEKTEGRKARYHVEALMIQAKRVLRAENADKPDVAEITKAIDRVRGDRQGGRAIFRLRRRRQDRLDVHQQRQIVSHHGQAADAPHSRQGAVQLRRQDDAQRAAAAGWSRAPRRGCCATTIS